MHPANMRVTGVFWPWKAGAELPRGAGGTAAAGASCA